MSRSKEPLHKRCSIQIQKDVKSTHHKSLADFSVSDRRRSMASVNRSLPKSPIKSCYQSIGRN